MISEQTLMVHAFVPGSTQSVPAGKLYLQEEGIDLLASRFVYGLKYLKRNGAIEIDPIGLGMLQGQQVAGQALFAQESALFGGIRDAAPDAWGRRVIEAKKRVPANTLPESTYLLEAGPNRTGALDITPDGEPARELGASTDIKSLGYLLEAAERIESGLPLPANLHGIFDAGSSPLYDVVPRPVHSQHRRLHLGVGAFGREATLSNALSWCEHFSLSRVDAIEVIDGIWRVVREWRNHFEEHGVAGDDIEAVSSAFLHVRYLGGNEVGIS